MQISGLNATEYVCYRLLNGFGIWSQDIYSYTPEHNDTYYKCKIYNYAANCDAKLAEWAGGGSEIWHVLIAAQTQPSVSLKLQKTPQPLVLYLEAKMMKSKEKKGKDREIPLQPVLCWRCWPKTRVQLIPKPAGALIQLQTKAHTKQPLPKMVTSQWRQPVPTIPHHNLAASPEGHRSHSRCRVCQAWHRQSSTTSPGRDPAGETNTTHCSNILIKNILKGISASVKSCKPSNVVDNESNPWDQSDKEWQQVSLSHAAAPWSSRMEKNFLFNFVGFGVFFMMIHYLAWLWEYRHFCGQVNCPAEGSFFFTPSAHAVNQ